MTRPESLGAPPPTPPSQGQAAPAGPSPDDEGGWSLPWPGSRLAYVGLGLLVVVGLAVGGFYFYTQPAEAPAAVDPDPSQSQIHNTLAPWFEAVLVDASDERVLIRYEQSEQLSRELAYTFARDTAALHAPGTDRIVVEAYEDYAPVVTWTVPTDVVSSYLEGNATYEDVQNATTVEEHEA